MSGKFYTPRATPQERAEERAAPVRAGTALREERQGHGRAGRDLRGFGFNYVGPIDGHDLDSLIPTLENLRDLKGPQFLHVVTKKGYGYSWPRTIRSTITGRASSTRRWHRQAATPPKMTFTQVFGQWLCDMAEGRRRLIGITPAMREGSGMVEFEKRFPKLLRRRHRRQHAVTFAAGLACEG
jgi:1-deoxy-D-xylulose-5-phosphate synthase